VRKLFEKAVLGFYRAHLSNAGWTVSGSQPLQWPVNDASAGARDWLPGMRLDISLRSPEGQRMVIDTKFTTLLQSGHHGKERFSSGHLYQLYAYLRTQAGSNDPIHDNAHGVLLYPSVGVDHLEWVTLQGHRMTLATVDLSSTPAKMRGDLMRVVGSQAG
jgi:5-methylcytosine-specific restriction enzyme subunit McrC